MIDLIERGDKAGWASAIDAGDFQTAGGLLDDALDQAETDDAETRMLLLLQSARQLLATGASERAAERAGEALAVAQDLDLPASLIKWSEFSLAVALSTSGDTTGALRLLNGILHSPDCENDLRLLAAKVAGEILEGG